MSNATTPFSVVLSYTELAYLLTFFDAVPTLGVDRNPFDGLAPGEIAVAHATARDALRARDLIRLDAEDRPLVNDDLLRVLESYKSPQMIITAYRYAAGEELPLAWIGYRRSDTMVIHTRPADLLHAFTLTLDAALLASALADFCAGDAPQAPANTPLTLPAGIMAQARAYADAGKVDLVAEVLRSADLDDDAITALASDLNNPVAVTAITIVATGAGAKDRRRDAIHWQSTTPAARLIVHAENDVVQISSGSDADLLVILNELM